MLALRLSTELRKNSQAIDELFCDWAGDAQELASIEKVFGGVRHPDNPLLIGSIKSNLGHTEGASGLAGLSCQHWHIVPHTFRLARPVKDKV